MPHGAGSAVTERPQSWGTRLRSGARWSGAEIALNLPVRLATLAILARLLKPEEFGIFAAAVTVIEFARPISALSVDHALVQSKELSAGTTAFASAFALALSSLVAMLIVYGSEATLLIYDDRDVPGIVRALALSIPLGALSGLLLAVLRRKLAFRELSVVVVVSSVLAALASIAVAVAGGGIWALVAGYYVDSRSPGALRLEPRPAAIRSTSSGTRGSEASTLRNRHDAITGAQLLGIAR